MIGRTFDLRAAYKQFPLSATTRSTLRIAVSKPGQSAPAILGVNALPFGVVGSVAGFLKLSHALWYIGTVARGLCWTAFYDDFSALLSREELIHSTSSSCELLLRLLGVDYMRTRVVKQYPSVGTSRCWVWWSTRKLRQSHLSQSPTLNEERNSSVLWKMFFDVDLSVLKKLRSSEVLHFWTNCQCSCQEFRSAE